MKTLIQPSIPPVSGNVIMDENGIVRKVVACSKKHFSFSSDARALVFSYPDANKKNDFADRWGRCMERLGAEKGTVQDLLSI